MQRGNVLITGTSSGIGRACALRFAQLGYRVFAGVRSAADGDALKAESPAQIEPVLLDVTSAASITAAVAAIGGEPLAGLVNNAGIAVAGPLELVSLERCRAEFEVNVIGLLAVTQAFLPHLRRGRGRIVNVGSIAGRSALPGSGVYDASKFAVEALTDVLRMELHRFGISVSVIEAGAVATAAWDLSLRDLDDLSQHNSAEIYTLYRGLVERIRAEVVDSARSAISPSRVAKAVEHAMTAPRPKTRYPVGPDSRFWLLLNLLPDRWRDRLILSKLEA